MESVIHENKDRNAEEHVRLIDSDDRAVSVIYESKSLCENCRIPGKHRE